MGNALVVMTVPEEAWMVPMREKAPAKGLRHTISLPVEARDVWEPPGEPTEQYGFKWYEHPEARRAHREAVRQSLEVFLNDHLARLYHMLRTGWWVMGKVRVRVVECRPVPEREMRQFASALRPRRTSGGRRRMGG